MITLISLAISVAYFYSMATLVWRSERTFLGTGHVDRHHVARPLAGMRSVRQASGALDSLAKLMPDSAEIIQPDGGVEEHPVDHLQRDDVVLVRPGAIVPADGIVIEGASNSTKR